MSWLVPADPDEDLIWTRCDECGFECDQVVAVSVVYDEVICEWVCPECGYPNQKIGARE